MFKNYAKINYFASKIRHVRFYEFYNVYFEFIRNKKIFTKSRINISCKIKLP